MYWFIHLGKSLGKGTFGKVKQATHTLTGEKVAVKILEKDKIKDKKDVERITREIKILKKVRHPSVIQLYEVRFEIIQNKDHRNWEWTVPDHGILFYWWVVRLYSCTLEVIREVSMQIIPGIAFRNWVYSPKWNMSSWFETRKPVTWFR